MKNTGKIQKAYQYFCQAEKERRSFTLNDIVEQTGWTLSTVAGYRTKKWHQFILDTNDGRLICKGLIIFPFTNFVKLHEQRIIISSQDYRPRFGDAVDFGIDKSREESLLAIQVYNNPTIRFRTEGFIVYMIISFTALFHAIYEKKGVEYWYIDEITGMPIMVDGDKKYWELSKCVTEYYKDLQTPEKENIKLCISMRNKIEHRYYDLLDLNLSGFCQSLLLNYEYLLTSEFGEFFSLSGNQLSLALQISTYNDAQKKALNIIQTKYYDEIKQYIDDFCQDLPVEILGSERFRFSAYLIPKIGNHATSSDISIEWVKYDPMNPEGMVGYQKMIGLIKEKTVQVANQGMYLPGVVVKLVKEKGIIFNPSLHTKAYKLYKVRPREASPNGCITKYCQFDEPHKNFIYTKDWVDFLVEKLQDPIEFQKIKKYKV